MGEEIDIYKQYDEKDKPVLKFGRTRLITPAFSEALSKDKELQALSTEAQDQGTQGQIVPAPLPTKIVPKVQTGDISKLDLFGPTPTYAPTPAEPHKDISAGYDTTGMVPGGTTPSNPPVQIAPQSAVINIGGGGGGQFKRTISKPVQEEFEQGFDETGAANMQEIGYAKQAEREAEAIRRAAADRAAAEMAQQIGTAEGQYFVQQNELKKVQDTAMMAQHEADDAVKQVKEGKVDPNKFYHEKDTLTNIGLALSVAMGAYWSTLTGGPNQAMQIVDKAIDRDIRAQEVNLANKRAVADTALRRNLMATGSLERAKELTRLQLLELTRMAATKMAMDNQSAVAEASHAKIMGALEGSINKAQAALTMAHAKYRMDTEQFVPAQSIGLNLLKNADEMMKHWVPGVGLVPDEGEAKDLRKDTAELAEFQRTLNKAATMLGDIGTLERKYKDSASLFRDPKFMEFQALIQRARFSRSNAAKQGVIREQEAANFDQMVANPNNWTSSEDAQKAMGAIAQDVNGELHSQKLQHAAQDAEIVQVRDPRTGFIKRVPIPQEMSNPGQSGFNQAPSTGIQLQPTLSK